MVLGCLIDLGFSFGVFSADLPSGLFLVLFVSETWI